MEILDPHLNKGAETTFSKSPRNKKYIASFAIYYCTFAFGVSGTFLGPCVVDFSHKFGTDVSQVAFVFTIMLGAYLFGAFMNGILSHWINRQIIVISLLAIGSLALFLFPYVSSIEIFFLLACFSGLYAGGYDSAQVAWIIDIWRHEAPPFILTQHFFYSLGTIVPPLILSPYLKGRRSDLNSNITLDTSENPEEIQEGLNLLVPFSVAGSILALGFLIQITFAIRFGLSSAVKSIESNQNRSQTQRENKCPQFRELMLIVLSCCFIAFYTGMEGNTMQFLPTFAHFSKVSLTQSQGADVLFGLTMAFCIGRGVGILIVLKAPPHLILFGNLVLITIANSILALFANDSVKMMWIGSVLLGLALSTTFPAYFAYIEKYLFISDSVSAVILVCAGGVSAVYPLVVGNLVENNPNVMIYVNFFSLSVLITSFFITFWLTFCKTGCGKFNGRQEETRIS